LLVKADCLQSAFFWRLVSFDLDMVSVHGVMALAIGKHALSQRKSRPVMVGLLA